MCNCINCDDYEVDGYSYITPQLIGSPDWVRIRVVASDGGDDPSWLLALPDCHLVMALRQDWAFVHVVNIDGDCGRGCRSIPAADQSHRVLSAEHEDVLTLALKVQDL